MKANHLPATTIDAMQIVINSKGAGEGYEIIAIDMDQKRHTLEAGALNLNGFAFATSGMEMGEYRRTIRVEREAGSRYVNFVTVPEDEQ